MKGISSSMKKIGLVGGIGPASTVQYYLGLVDKCKKEQGIYPEIVIDSVNMSKHDAALDDGDYDRLCNYLVESISNLQAAGAELAAITANTEHIVWERVCNRFPIPTISILDATVDAIKHRGYQKVLIFGTAHTMRSGIYDKSLEKSGIRAVLPSENDIIVIGNLIYPNLENGIVIPADQEKLIELANAYIEKEKVDAMVLGCTELSLAIKPDDIGVPLLDTTQIHIQALYEEAKKGW